MNKMNIKDVDVNGKVRTEDTLINWSAQTLDGRSVESLYHDSYRSLYKRLEEKYSVGLSSFFGPNAIEIAILEYYGEDLDEYDVMVDGTLGDYGKYVDWVWVDLYPEVNEIDDYVFRLAIENANMDLQNQKFEFVEV